jgi:putative endonuclease
MGASTKPRSNPAIALPAETTRARGQRAERAASDYLLARGYRILESNFRCPRGELDIIAEDDNGVLCFVEVRSRTRGPKDFGRPLETIGNDKRKRVIRAAEHYVFERQLDEARAMRFDVVGVLFDDSTVTLELLRDAFSAN